MFLPNAHFKSTSHWMWKPKKFSLICTVKYWMHGYEKWQLAQLSKFLPSGQKSFIFCSRKTMSYNKRKFTFSPSVWDSFNFFQRKKKMGKQEMASLLNCQAISKTALDYFSKMTKPKKGWELLMTLCDACYVTGYCCFCVQQNQHFQLKNSIKKYQKASPKYLQWCCRWAIFVEN